MKTRLGRYKRRIVFSFAYYQYCLPSWCLDRGCEKIM